MRYFLTGFPGSGKTRLGVLWAAKNGLQFYDLDILIEEEERKTVAEIFEAYGEGYFRELEAAMLRNTDRFENCIIACGGGTPCFFDNMQWMNRNGITVFLDQDEEIIFSHLRNDPKVRPLIADKDDGALKDYIIQERLSRLPFYRASTYTLKPDSLNAEGFEQIIQH